MNKNLLIVAVIATIVLVVGGFYIMNKKTSTIPESAPTTQTQNQTNPTSIEKTSSQNKVTIKGFQYESNTITVKVGASVTWTNVDGMEHSATADDDSFDTGLMGQNESKTIKFDKAGTFAYHCSIHPNMHGTVIVTEQ